LFHPRISQVSKVCPLRVMNEQGGTGFRDSPPEGKLNYRLVAFQDGTVSCNCARLP
jgi:hypothetical protein